MGGGQVKWLQYYIGGGQAKWLQYYIGRGGSTETPKSDYVIYGWPLMGKEPLEELKLAIFKNWLDTRPKMETHDPNVYPTILGGVSRGFWTPFLDWGAQSVVFWHVKTGTFNIFGRVSSQFLKIIFFGPFYPFKRPKNENGWQTFVYGSILLKIFLVALITYSHHW